MSYMVDQAPPADPVMQTRQREWEPKEHRPTLTWSRSGYKPYNTYVIILCDGEVACTNPLLLQGEEQVLALGASCEAPAVSTQIFSVDGTVHTNGEITLTICLHPVVHRSSKSPSV
jgi:hypothetical protein